MGILLRKVESEFEKIWKARDEGEVRAQVHALNAEIAKVNARTAEGPPTRLGPLDADGVVGMAYPLLTLRLRRTHMPEENPHE